MMHSSKTKSLGSRPRLPSVIADAHSRAIEERVTKAKELEATARDREVSVREQDAARAWKLQSPVTAALVIGVTAVITNALVAYNNGNLEAQKLIETRRLQAIQAEQSRLLQALQAPPDKAADNLQFLLQIGLIADPELVIKLNTYLASRKAGEGPSIVATRPLDNSGYYTSDGSGNLVYLGKYANSATGYVETKCEKSGANCPPKK